MDAQCQSSILIVEDDASIRMLIIEVLQQGGYQTTAVIDAETALQEMRTGTFGMVLTDYQLPGISGDQLISRITKTWPQTRTLLMSAHPDVAQMAERCKADAMFRKGEPMAQLLACVTGLLPATSAPGCYAS